MSRTVSAADAKRQVSKILGSAAQGESVTITRRGTPAAQLVPYHPDADGEDNGRAWDRLLAALEEGIDLGGERFDRDARYER